MKRLYAETDAPLGEIARRFGISLTSVARIAQRHGVALRGGRDTPPGGGQQTAPARARPPRAAASVAEPEPAPVAARSRRGRLHTGGQAAPSPEPGVSALASVPQTSGSSVRRRFRVRFVAEQVLEAAHLREVIARVETLGATEITSIVRED